MNKIYIVFCLLFFFFSLSVSAQQFSQYNTGTLYDSFENPSQRSFIPDSSRQYAFNFLIPNFDANTYVTGNIQPGLKSRLFSRTAFYDTEGLKIGKGQYNHFNANVNAYSIMFKVFTSLNGDVEMGFSAQTKVESRGLFSDESLALLNGVNNFHANSYSDIFNDTYRFQAYHQLSFSYRERINNKFALGFKVSGLLGIQYQQIDIVESHISFNREVPTQPTALLYLRGRYYDSYIPGQMTAHDYLPTFRNPGAAVSLGASYKTDDRITIQANVKDLGFIHWSKRSAIYDFNNSEPINDLTSTHREDTLYNRTHKLLKNNGTVQSFTTPINGRAELSATKSYWLGDGNNLKYTPTLIASKELFYAGFTGALVNHFQFGKFTATLTTSYDDMKFFNLGTQFMVKSPNVEFFVGTDRLINTGRFALASLHNDAQIQHEGDYSGGDLYLGFSLKFGHVIEHPMNASSIPMGEKGFFGRLFGRLFKTDR
ncbi:DUF5723 family protein [Mucilaginibacter sabulilitoris]|uniref:DUF5723 family protein n=1 Tax=Mucilaginibacter sabulilitoris TaxID=1173583 RepID=A0ABZ0TV38_9SPHI|nr:DUF5723 family protein [Mucilaginibacter sabulilitoris]WPU96789.1 DUF5723 family protein [Mucilaginibacter sabulilitoris]